jgi:hypothetical protein
LPAETERPQKGLTWKARKTFFDFLWERFWRPKKPKQRPDKKQKKAEDLQQKPDPQW